MKGVIVSWVELAAAIWVICKIVQVGFVAIFLVFAILVAIASR